MAGARFYAGRPNPYTVSMIRWFAVVFFALVLLSAFTPWLHRLGFGQLPGDLRFRLFGREWSVPLASTILLSLGLSLLVRVLSR